MEAHTLDVDTSKNVQTCMPARPRSAQITDPIAVTSGLHRMFGKTVAGRPAGWFLQPAEPRIIANMHERYVGVAVNWPSPPALPESFPNTREDPDNVRTSLTRIMDLVADLSLQFYAEERFSYRIFAFEGMKESQDVRVFTGSHTFGISNGDFFQYDFPFCVKFWSHVPYHFAIANSGQKLWALFGRGPIVLPKSEFTLALLTAMRNIYVAWQSSKPTVAFKAGLGANISSGLVHHSRPPRTRLQARSAARPSQPSETFQPTAACSSRTAADKRGKSGGNEGSLRPWDSASCRTAVGRAETDGDDDEAPFEDDEDAEYEDPEWLEWLQEWCRDVRRATEAEDSGSLPDCTPVAELP